jgi:hypothetical protein
MPKMNKGLYRQIFVWRRKNKSEAIRYACLESVTTGLFYVQSADFFRLPVDGEQARLHDMQFVELFIEDSVADRANGHATLASAIAQHDIDFSN